MRPKPEWWANLVFEHQLIEASEQIPVVAESVGQIRPRKELSKFAQDLGNQETIPQPVKSGWSLRKLLLPQMASLLEAPPVAWGAYLLRAFLPRVARQFLEAQKQRPQVPPSERQL